MSIIVKFIRKLIGVEHLIEENKREMDAQIKEITKRVNQMKLMREDPEAFEKLSQTPEFIEQRKKDQKIVNERKAKDAKELADRRAKHDEDIVKYYAGVEEYIKNNS